MSIKVVQSFLGHVNFYRWFTKDFSKIAHPVCKILYKEEKFGFNGDYVRVFNRFKEKLVPSPSFWPQIGHFLLNLRVMQVA